MVDSKLNKMCKIGELLQKKVHFVRIKNENARMLNKLNYFIDKEKGALCKVQKVIILCVVFLLRELILDFANCSCNWKSEERKTRGKGGTVLAR